MGDKAKIRDFRCGYSNSVGVSNEVTEPLGLDFPDAYLHRDTMVQLSRAVKEHDGAGFCLLPFCRTVEVEALGGNVNMGNANTGPRAGNPVCSTIEDLAALPEIDCTHGRIHEVLEACRLLKQQGEVVCLEVTGPWTMAQNLMDSRKVFKFYRKQPEEMTAALRKLASRLLPYVEQAREVGVDIIMFSDSAGTLSILGPKLMERATREITYDFVKQLDELVDGSMVIQLCPKLVYALIDTGLADFRMHELGERVDFLEALLRLRGTVRLAGQTCVKSTGVAIVNGRIRELVLK